MESRIAFVVPGGVDRSGTHRVIPCVLWLIEALARDHDVHVFALRQELRPAAWDLLGARVHNIGARPRYARLVGAILRQHRRAPFDFVYAIWAEAGLPAGVAARIIRKPLLLHLTGGDLVAMPEIDYGLLLGARGRARLKIATAAASRVLVPSEPTRAAAARLGIDAERIALGVSLERWKPRAPRRRRSGEPLRLVHVASLNVVKDQATLLHAARRLLDAGTAFHLDIVGDDTMSGAVQRMADQMSLARHTTFHGFLPQTVLRPLLERSHVLVVSSRHETGPIVALEAAVAGVPTVGTAVGHIAEWAPHAAAAVRPGDAEGLAREILTLAADEERRIALATAARQRAIAEDARFTARQVVRIATEIENPVREADVPTR